MYKNVANQQVGIYAHNTANDAPETGDAANITAYISKDGGAAAQTNDINPTEIHAVNMPGYYVFDLTQAESNCDLFALVAQSSTADVQIDPVIVYTLPGDSIALDANVVEVDDDAAAANNLESDYDGTGYNKANSIIGTASVLTGHTPQTGDNFARLGAPAGASIAADIAAIEAQTDDIGIAGAGLTAIPWNAAWDPEVQSEVQDALEVNRLDHLVAVADADDPVDDSIIAKLAADDGDWSNFTETTDSQEAIRNKLDAISVISFPTGAIAYTYTVTNSDTGLPVEGVEVWFTTDLAGTNVVWAGVTDAFGVARDTNNQVPMLDAGTYYVFKQLAGFIDNDGPDTEVVS